MAKATNPRQIRRQIRSVQNLKKITKAMEMVSAAKLRRVQTGLMAIRPYSDKLRELVRRLAARTEGRIDAPLITPRAEVRRRAFVVFAADKGLCGSYNSGILRLGERTLAETDKPAQLYTIGRRAGDYFRKRGFERAGHWQGLPATVGIAEAREIANKVIGAYQREEVDEVHLVYTQFVSAGRYAPKSFQFLPFDASTLVAEDGAQAGAEATGQAEMIFEPEPKVILSQLIPRYVEVLFFRTLLEALASEHAARMTAMKNATDNAQDMVKSLTLTYNKARQGSITTELLDIVGGAEALKG